MSRLQIFAVAVTIGLNALDGFDVLAISFASPGIAAEWGIDPAALGFVLSMELIGMSVGSVLLGGVADRLGRRGTMLGCLVLMAFGMFMATTTRGIVDLSLWRIVTGLGIGGMLAATAAVAAEFSNRRRRDLCVSLMAIGYPIGAVLGGSIAAQLLAEHGWRSVFYFGAAVTAAFIPIVFFFVPESVHWLARKQPAGAFERINRTLRRMGHAAIRALPEIPADARGRSGSDLFAPALLGTTVIVAAAYFFHIMTFYFVLKWVPKIVADMGFAASSAAGVLVWANVGGAVGGAVLGLLTQRFNVKALTIGAMVLSTVLVTVFGRSPEDLARLSMLCAFAGFFTNGAIVGMYAIFAKAFPTHVRASGTGFSIGVGRGGSVLGPVLAGFLFDGGVGLPTVALVMGLGSLLAAGVLMLLKLEPKSPEAADAEPAPLTRAPASP
ncbi:MAG: MFS transporter [Gammaproteobacteria bacterium]|nr:MFS transporter [Gammaproteobacteria bacterium]